MLRGTLLTFLLISGLNGMGSDINYDERFNQMENQEVDRAVVERVERRVVNTNRNSLENIGLETFAFKEVGAGKMVPIRRIKVGGKVVYINKVINSNDEARQDIVIKNPIPMGTTYLKGSAICNGGCTISYSNDGGATLVEDESLDNIDYIEFYFKTIPSYKEYRMGFRATVNRHGG